jgi:hypothetical protein
MAIEAEAEAEVTRETFNEKIKSRSEGDVNAKAMQSDAK